jgi:type II secretory pathway pseudopilin PulG
MTLIEVLASLGILAVSIVGLVAGLLVAVNANTYSAKRTQMLEFAQGRMERLVTRNRASLCGASSFSAGLTFCTSMAHSGAFDPTVAPNSGGWVADTVDGVPAAAAGDDTLQGPVAVFADNNAIDTAKTTALRNAFFNNSLNCGDGTTTVTVGGAVVGPISKDPSVICREIHSEASDVGSNPTVPMLHIWVRVIRGGWAKNPPFTTGYMNGSVLLDRLVYRPQ